MKFQIEIYQWLVPLIALFFMYRIFVQFRNNKRLLTGTILWIVFWITISILAIIPDLVSFSIAETLGFKSNINAVIFVALGFLFLMTYYQSSTIERLEKQITDLVRKIALEKQDQLDSEKENENEAA